MMRRGVWLTVVDGQFRKVVVGYSQNRCCIAGAGVMFRDFKQALGFQ
ncbi:hypothetical protein [Roseovarius sp. A-2]|nr:hypothetical protein [Roseovarius sp. A-2]